jgi:hypothetical protein
MDFVPLAKIAHDALSIAMKNVKTVIEKWILCACSEGKA